MSAHETARIVRAWIAAGIHRCAALCGLLLWDHIRRRLQAGKPAISTLEVQKVTVNERKMTMTKPFDLADLLAKMKSQGLPVLEKDVELVTKCVLAWGAESCALSGGFAAMAAPLFPLIEGQLIKLEDRIDGQENS